ncbi:hypothetical protein HPP92_003110 [Vanilla planifolia]|uniref:Uncharacterized protein n=1 Tax=Vanilla planifolia TaxID=51239 RepID=A0A835RZD5_VANPL|nr:hypothetical protein HPP92_003110 [Vanilla planifolia]
MGSLMAGWHSFGKDPKHDKLRSNSSLTRADIEAFWKEKKRAEEEHLGTVSGHQNYDQENNLREWPERMQRSLSMPLTDRKLGLNLDDQELKKSKCWWTRSYWAFLNEPPVEAMEGPAYKYAAQYHIAETGRSGKMNSQETKLP